MMGYDRIESPLFILDCLHIDLYLAPRGRVVGLYVKCGSLCVVIDKGWLRREVKNCLALNPVIMLLNQYMVLAVTSTASASGTHRIGL
jgi:hypothetical protein